jgi:hypothetical protein
MAGAGVSKKEGAKTGGSGGGLLMKMAIGVALLGAALHLRGYHVPTTIVTLIMTAQTGIHGFYGAGLWLQESLTSHPPPTFVPLGYWNSLQLKMIYVSRYFARDNFLFEDWMSDIHATILRDFEARGLQKDQDVEFAIPSYEFKDADLKFLFDEYVMTGRPVVLRNVNVKAMHWTADILKERFGSFETPMRCMNGSVVKQTLGQYVDSREKEDPPCYFDNNANLFEAYPEMTEELEVDRFGLMMGGKETPRGEKPDKFLFAQMFLSVFQETGALFHCANYNNLFYMIRGNKKWTFVDPSNSFLIYPFFNGMFKDSKSWLTWQVIHADNATDIIAKYFPLYRYAPKLILELKPGDLLMNPPWNWHMVENSGDESIGIATRWKFPSSFFTLHYTNALFSFLQFSSEEFYTFMYRRIASLKFGFDAFVYAPTSHGDLDVALNFGKLGSVYAKSEFVKNVATPTQWVEYIAYLNKTDALSKLQGQK